MKSEEDKFLFWFTECFDFVPGDLNMTSVLANIDDFNSLTRLNVLAMIDTEYGITIESAILNACKTAEELFQIVKEKRKG